MKKTYIKENGLKIQIVMLEEKKMFGRAMVLIEPTEGYGRKWVNKDRIEEE